MIHKGKAYKEVLDGSAEVGDLVHVVKLDNVPLDFYALITRFDTEGDKRLDSLLPDNTDFLIDDDDTDFKVYRHVKEEEEVSGTTKTKVEEANTIYTDVMVELELLANSREDQQKLLDNRIQEIKEEQEQLRHRNDQLDTVRRVLEAL
ncbi:hypothetical protein [Brochothrix phage ADU4]|nr:hypothetical protein [Brochothrix phage ADU4]